MKKFLYRMLNFLLIVVGILVLKTALITPNISNEIYFTKYNDYLAKSADAEYNTLFFGSSRIYRHIDPEQFDSLGTDYNLSSYNLGAPATFNPELYYIYDRFLEDYRNGSVPDSINIIFIELQRINNLTFENALTAKGSYWNSFEYYLKSLQQIKDTRRRKSDKVEFLSNYSVSFLINMVSIYPKSKILDDYQSILKEGYIGLEDELEIFSEQSLLKRKEDFIKEPSVINIRADALRNTSIENLKTGYVNTALDNEVKRMISKSRKLGIQVYFIIPPRQSIGVYKELYPILRNNPNNVIDMASISDYPELYKIEHSFDVGHLNHQGVKYFTRYIHLGFRGLESSE